MIFGYMLFMDFKIEFYKNYNFFVFEERFIMRYGGSRWYVQRRLQVVDGYVIWNLCILLVIVKQFEYVVC